MPFDSAINSLATRIATEIKSLRNTVNTKIAWGDAVHYTNPFGGKRLYFSQVHNGFFRANERWNVTGVIRRSSDGVQTATLSAADAAKLFDGDYESGPTIPADHYLVLTMDFSPTTTYPGYPYGDIYIGHYYTSRSQSVSARVYTTYAPHGGPGWVNLAAPVAYSDTASAQIWRLRNWIFQITTLEITITAPASTVAQITEIDFAPDRPGTAPVPFVDKYRANDLYSALRWFQNKVQTASITEAGAAAFASVTSGGQSVVVTNDARLGITGEIKMWPTATAPSGYLLCQGGTFQSTTYPALAALLGDTFGTHSGTTYYLPDYRGRSPIGAGMVVPTQAGNAYTLGQKYGDERLQTHTHAVNDPSHSHYEHAVNWYVVASTENTGVGGNYLGSVKDSAVTASPTNISIYDAGSGSGQNVQPSLGINFIIKT